MMKFKALIFLAFLCLNSFAEKPKLLLAKTYQTDIHIEDYWVSEKLDGVRAYWDGRHLISRQGNIYNAPSWFTAPLPNTHLDGELWIERNQFSKVSGLVRRQGNKPENWRNIKYMIFDLPDSLKTFGVRIVDMRSITKQANVAHLKTIEQFKVASHDELKAKLDTIVKLGGEGLMLHLGSSIYKSGRSNDLLKLKTHLDAEAMVIKHIEGKGKYKGLLGALLVETTQHIQFKIGTGFSDKERENPPAIGTQITYKYFGLTSTGKPRFASFMRVRKLQ